MIDIASSKPQQKHPGVQAVSHKGNSSLPKRDADASEDAALERARQVFAERSSIFTFEYQRLLVLLRQARQEVGLTQVQLGERLGQPQAVISKCERGERRLDAIELRAYCTAMGISYLQLLEQLERNLADATSIG